MTGRDFQLAPGSHHRRSIEEIREFFDEVRKDIWPAVEQQRKLQLPIDRVFAFDNS
jgi:NADPH2:quinone reductase